MKTALIASLLLPVAALLLTAPAALADGTDTPAESSFDPKEYPLSRYDHLNKKSPFEFDPPAEPTSQSVDPFEGVSLAGYCGSGNTMTVYLIVGKEKKRISVYGDGSPYKKRDDSGFRVIGIKRGKTLKATSITIEKDGQQKEVSFDEETLRPKGGAGGAQQNVQMVPGPDGKMVPKTVIPRPGGNIIQSQQAYQAPQAFVPGQSNKPQMQQNPQNPQNPQFPQPGVSQNAPGGQVTSMSNQQMITHLTSANAPQGVVAPQPAAPQPNVGGADGAVRSAAPPPRRRVVLPTQP